MSILVYVPQDAALPGLTASDISVIHYESSSELERLLAGSNDGSAAVILSTGFDINEQETIAAAVRSSGARVLEVREERWDGFSASPLSAACRGVIAGFGANGISAAIAALRVL